MPRTVTVHPKVKRTIAAFEATELHAARSGREVMEGLAAVIADSRASTMDGLALELDSNVGALLQAMPAYAPPINVMHQVYWRFEQARSGRQLPEGFRADMAQMADAFRSWSEQARAAIAGHGANLIPEGGTVFTFTLSETVLSTLRGAWGSGVRFKVLVTESRPNSDGRLTARALTGEGIAVELGIDASIGGMIPRSDVMLVGAEAVLSDGSAVCKVGTYPCALLAVKHRVPVYVLIDSLKFHPTSLFGQSLRLDPLGRKDVMGEGGNPHAAVSGHWYDRTPADAITAIVTERGLLHPKQAAQWMLEMPVSDTIVARLRERPPRGPLGA